MPSRRKVPNDTERSTNIAVPVSERRSVDEMEALLRRQAASNGLVISHVTVLGRKRFPGNRHWHLKQDLKQTGCLDLTYWPDGPLMWVTIRNSEPDWVHVVGRQLATNLGSELAADA